MAWRYLVERATGEGAGSIIEHDLPLSGVSITSTLSGPDRINGAIERSYERLVAGDGRELLEPWGAIIYAESDDEIRGGAFVELPSSSGPQLTLDCPGFSYYAKDIYYDDSWYGIDVDPLDVVRRIWAHIQSKPGGNIGLQLGSTTSPVRIGTQIENVQFQTSTGESVAFEAGPVKLNWWTTDDCAGKVDELAKETPFDYRERHAWVGNTVGHYLDFGYPRLGRRRDDLRFALGENISKIPQITRGDYATEIIAMGSGEGRDSVRGVVSNRQPGRLRRVGRISDKQWRSSKAAVAAATLELSKRNAAPLVGEITVRQHDNAPIGSWQVGDEVPVIIDSDWNDINSWLRIVSSTIYPENGDIATLKVVRTDRGVL